MKDIVELQVVNLITYFGTSSQITSTGTDKANAICRIICSNIYNLQEYLVIEFMIENVSLI